jgi:hypothetical protein
MTRRRVLSASAILAGVLAAAALLGAAATLPTPAEEAHYRQYSQHEAIARFLSRVPELSPQARVRVIGRTREVRGYPSQDLYLCLLSQEGISRPEERSPEKPTVLIIASQHGNEQSAKEAALRLIRDAALGDLRPLLERLNLLVIPQANPYGNFFDRRTNEQDLDLNRDHVKLESEETAAIHRVFGEWLPEVTIDLHEKGDDYYRVSIGCVSNLNIDPAIEDYARGRILVDVDRSLARSGIPFHEYLVRAEMGVNTSAGGALPEEDLRRREFMTRYSTTDLNDGRNSLGIYNTLSFIQECSSRHNLETLEERTGWQSAGLRAFLESVARNAAAVNSLVRESRADLLEDAGRDKGESPVILKMDYARDPEQPELVLKQFQNAESPILGVLKAGRKAGEAVSEDDLAPYPWPSRIKVVTRTVRNWFPRVEPRLTVERPRGYIIPASRSDIVETLLRHGLAVQTFIRDARVEEDIYRVVEVVPAGYDYLPPRSLTLEKESLTALVKEGDFYVSCRQPGANLIPCLLEPQSDYGLIRYQAFDLVPDKGEFYALARSSQPGDLPLAPYGNFLR